MPSLRLLSSSRELVQCEAVQLAVWGMAERGIVPMAHLAASIHAGGMVAGAFVNETLVGFVYGFPATRGGSSSSTGLHSHMLAVIPAYRGQGLGKALKWYQRDWCLEKGLSWMTWTFDPLQRLNAHLNFEYLGITVKEYLINAYGELEDELNVGLPTDRLIALWNLLDERVVNLVEGKTIETSEDETIPKALSQSREGRPSHSDLHLTNKRVSVSIPSSIGHLMTSEPELAKAWRFAVREVLLSYLGKGYFISHFCENEYILENITAIYS